MPESLRERIAVTAAREERGLESCALPAGLARLAEALIEEAKSERQTRETALTVLAADAVITLACEALAEEDPAALRDLR